MDLCTHSPLTCCIHAIHTLIPKSDVMSYLAKPTGKITGAQDQTFKTESGCFFWVGAVTRNYEFCYLWPQMIDTASQTMVLLLRSMIACV